MPFSLWPPPQNHHISTRTGKKNPAEMDQEVEMEEQQQEEILRPSFPSGRVKRIVKLDTDISKINSDALFLVSLSADLFLGFLAEGARRVAVERKKRTIKLEHIRSAARRHPPTNDFLPDCLLGAEKAAAAAAETEKAKKMKVVAEDKPLPKGVRRIDGFFKKTEMAVDHE